MSVKMQATTTKVKKETRTLGWRLLMGAKNTVFVGCDALFNDDATKYTGKFHVLGWTSDDIKIGDETKDWFGSGNLTG